MTLECFHLFPCLPPEIRHEIWGFAVRDQDSLLRVHYLTIAKRKTQHVLLSSESEPSDATSDDKYTNMRRRAPVPLVIPPPWTHPLEPPPSPNFSNILSQFSWAQGPRSIYVQDAGLWTACRESRAIITLRTAPWCHAMASFTTNDETNYLTVRPFSDLICFDPTHLSPKVTWAVLLANLPFYNLRHRGGALVRDPRPCEIDHLAFEFDSSWVECPPPFWSIACEATARGFVQRTIHHLAREGPPCTVYLIDRTLAHDSLICWDATLHTMGRELSGNLGERAYFVDAQDRYVEIEPGDIVPIPGVAEPPQPDVFKFREHIQGFRLPVSYTSRLPRWKFSAHRDVRVLCCLPSRRD